LAKKTEKEKQKELLELLEKALKQAEPALRLGLWAVGTVTFHKLNIGGIINWFGQSNEYIPTGLPYPFDVRIRFPWESTPEPTWEDQVTEWAIPALLSYAMVYHPEAIAQFVDAMVPF